MFELKIFHPGSQTSFESLGLLILRLIVGVFMLTHGFGKLLMLLGINGDPSLFPDPLRIGSVASLAMIVFAEFFCSIFLLMGFFTRFAVLPLFLGMLVAALVFHAKDPFQIKELSLLYGAIYLSFFFIGGGKFSIDYLIYKYLLKKNKEVS